MGYSILMSGEGDQVTETKAEEENITVITLTSNGYVMESYSVSSSSPCCYYTFTIESSVINGRNQTHQNQARAYGFRLS